MALSRILALMARGALPVDYLIAGGGASGGAAVDGASGIGGGGGAGGLRQGSLQLTAMGAYPIVVGLGGAAQPGGINNGLDGGNSTALGLTAIGGGGGGTPNSNGRPGGSGGGASNTDTGTRTGGAGTAGQGFDGGPGGFGSVGAGGGGGAGGAGGATDPGTGIMAVGPGVVSSISGTAVTYCQGGGDPPTTPANTGQGGQRGRGFSTTGASGAGADGVVIIRYLGGVRGTGGTITSAGSYTIHTFTTSGTFTRTS